jgi:hypothetical protein
LIDTEVFESIYTAGKHLLLAGWRDAVSAQSWSPGAQARASVRHRQVRIIRDYGMFERREAPQFYPTMKRESAAAAKEGAQDGRTSAASR